MAIPKAPTRSKSVMGLPEGKATVDDLANFATGGVTV